MGYKLLYGKQILFDPYTNDTITDAQLSMSINTASYLDFTISTNHSLYNKVEEHVDLVELYFDKIKLFAGEISEIDTDIYGNKSISCTGILDYLKDTIVRPYSTVEGEAPLKAPSSVDGYFQWLISQHNSHCMDSKKKFTVGVNQGNILDTNNYIYRASSQRPTTASELEDKLLNSIGGYLFVRFYGDMNILDLYADAHEANTQIIDFGVNITDFTKTISTDEQYTAVIATGYTPENSSSPITLEGATDGGTPYSATVVKKKDVVYDVDAVAKYGYKEYYISNTDITTYDGLLRYAVKTLNTLLSPSLTITVKAVDLALYMENGYEHLQIGQAVRVRSKFHNVDEYLMVNSITLDLQDPGNTEYQLGVAYDTLTGQQSSYLKSLNAGINSSLDSVAALDKVTKENAKNIDEAKKKADDASAKAYDASTKVDQAAEDIAKANEAAKKAQEDAAAAIGSAKDAADKAANASQKADDNTAKITIVENTIKTISGDTATAIANAEAAKTSADAASKAASEAKTAADAANTEIGKVQSQVGNINTEISNIKQDATDLRDDLSGRITTVKNTMEADYTRKTELSDTTATLRNEISESAAGVIQTVSQDYATKTELQTTTEATNKNATDLTNAFTKIGDLQNQIDGAIQTWFYDGEPSDDTPPTSDWNDDNTKNIHLGDLYYDNKTGFCYRYKLQNGVYSWERIQDTDVTKALAEASNAQKTANAKKRIFITTPKPPYDVGDLWVQGSDGDIMRCDVSKTEDQTYADTDWVKASKYTDDSAVTTLSNYIEQTYSTKSEVKILSDRVSSTVSSLETVKISAEAAKTSADAASKAASEAKTAADAAKANADTAQSKAEDAAKNLATAEANLKKLQTQADATDEQLTAAKAEVEKAKTAAADAKTAADTAKDNAITAQATANTAKANAKSAQDAVNALKNRVTSAETKIEQNSEAIALRATKTELTEVKNTADTAKANAKTAVDTANTAKSTADDVKTNLETNYSTTTQMNSAIDLKADSITSTVSHAYLKIEDANKNYASSERVESIESKLTQTEDSITASFNSLKKQIDDKTEVVNAWITEGSDGTNPYLELGTTESNLKTRLTNSELAFMDGTNKVASISNNTMSISNAKIDNAKINSINIEPWLIKVNASGHFLIEYNGHDA